MHYTIEVEAMLARSSSLGYGGVLRVGHSLFRDWEDKASSRWLIMYLLYVHDSRAWSIHAIVQIGVAR